MITVTYDWTKASAETLEAMRDRCHEEGHDYVNCMSSMFAIFQRCRWCGEIR